MVVVKELVLFHAYAHRFKSIVIKESIFVITHTHTHYDNHVCDEEMKEKKQALFITYLMDRANIIADMK